MNGLGRVGVLEEASLLGIREEFPGLAHVTSPSPLLFMLWSLPLSPHYVVLYPASFLKHPILLLCGRSFMSRSLPVPRWSTWSLGHLFNHLLPASILHVLTHSFTHNSFIYSVLVPRTQNPCPCEAYNLMGTQTQSTQNDNAKMQLLVLQGLCGIAYGNLFSGNHEGLSLSKKPGVGFN